MAWDWDDDIPSRNKKTTLVDVDWFFGSPERFPWDYMGIPYPGVGPLHICLCRAARTFCDPAEHPFMQSPAWYELVRIARIAEGAQTIRSIVEFVEANPDPRATRSKATLVMEWLHRQAMFVSYMQEKLDKDYAAKVISISADAIRR